MELRSDNHYVSQGYLKRWESSHKKVFVYRSLVAHNNVPKWKEQSIKGIGYQRHLYTQLLSGGYSDELERYFSDQYEAPAEKSIIKAVSNSGLDSEDWRLLVNFFAVHDVRTPLRLIEHLRRAEKQLPIIMNEVLGSLEEKLKRKEIPASTHVSGGKGIRRIFPLAVSVDKNSDEESTVNVETTPGRSTWVFSIKHLLSNTSSILHKNRWTIMRPAQGMYWPTSDNPVIKLNYYSPGNYDFKGGWYNPGTELLFPLGPEHLMYSQVNERPHARGTRFSHSDTQIIRKIILENAHRYIFCNRIDEEIEGFRPRVVSREQFLAESNQWKQWHQIQTQIESQYFGDQSSRRVDTSSVPTRTGLK